MIVNHYKLTAIGVDRTLVFMVQENENIGSDTWTYIYDGIERFEYEFGYVYELDVKRRTIRNPPADAFSIQYELIEVISKTEVQNDVSFDLILKSVSMISPPNFVFGERQSGYSLLNKVDIDCNSIGDELSEALANENEVKGKFTHLDSNLIKLENIIIE